MGRAQEQTISFSIKKAAPHIEDVLVHIINLSLLNFPLDWKTQLIHPFHKKADKCVGENYRPVSHIVVKYGLLGVIVNHAR